MTSARSATEATFKAEVLENSKPVLVDFWAPWCPPCRAIGPTVDQIAEQHSKAIDVVKINVDENPELAARFAVQTIPTFKVFVDGNEIKSMINPRNKAAIESELSDYLPAL